MKKVLASRYTPEVIALAEDRRRKLDYTSLHVGKSTTCRIDRILALLYETHQNYYFGHFNASCVLGGVLFEQVFICLLEEEIGRKGLISYKQGKEEINITDPNDLADQSLLALIHMAKNYKIIPRDHLRLVTELRVVRNYLMHDDLGRFMQRGENYEFELLSKVNNTLVGTRIAVPVAEVEERCLTSDSPEIWAYYVLSRTRQLISDMFEGRVKRLPPETSVDE